jgi:N-acetylneuraminic acid mutarotase
MITSKLIASMKFSSLSTIVTTLLLFLSFQSLQAQQTMQGWQMLDTDTQPTHRHENAATVVDGKLYLLGGRGERPVDVFDPKTNSWQTKATPPLSMHHFQAVTYNDKIYVLGALNGTYPYEDPIANVYIYDPQTDNWTKGPAIPEDRRRGAAGVAVHKDKIYIAGGIQNGHADGHVRWFDSFDPQTGEWTKLTKAPRKRDHFQLAVVGDKLYAAGGRRSSQATGETFELTIPEVDVYDFATQEWTELPPSGDLPTERAGSTSISVGDYLIVLGGESAAQQDAHAEVEAFNTKTGQWHALPSLNQGRHGTQAVIVDGTIHIAAGSKVRGAEEINSHETFAIPDSISTPSQ